MPNPCRDECKLIPSTPCSRSSIFFWELFCNSQNGNGSQRSTKIAGQQIFTKSANEIGHFGLWRTKLRNCVEEENLKIHTELVSNIRLL
jgi:hypothetical protein